MPRLRRPNASARTIAVTPGQMARRAVATILVAAAVLAPATQADSAGKGEAEFHYAQIVRVASDTLLIAGRELNVPKGEADIGNAILSREGDTLYIIDTGATRSFRPALRRAVAQLRPFTNVVLLNSHGHPDHIGNNDILSQIKADSRRYYMSRRDFGIADGLNPWLRRAFDQISGYVPGFDDAGPQTRDLLRLFEPLRTARPERRAIESLPATTVRIGHLRARGWDLGGGEVIVLPTHGHTPGSLSFYFPRTHLLHVADELNGYYPAFPEADPPRIRRVFGMVRAAATEDGARLLTDGHTFAVIRGTAAAHARAQRYIDGYDAFNRAFRRILTSTPGGLTVSQIIDEVTRAPELAHAVGGSDFGPFSNALLVRRALRQVGATSTGGPAAKARFSLPG